MVREALTIEALSALEPREAAAYFLARRAEGLTSSEESLLADWLARDEQNQRMFASADHAWQSFAAPEDDEILAAMRAHALRSRRSGLARWRPAAAAAGLLVAACAAFFFLIPDWRSWFAQSVTYASARGEVQEIHLADGSTMTLDADSIAVARISSDGRSIQLQRGRAYFDVASDAARPFTVTAAERRVVAIGTRFDVNLAADVLIVTLLEGRVDVTAPELVSLQPGQQYIERPGEAPRIETLGAASESAIAWRSGLVNLDGLTLAEAVSMSNRYTQDQIVITDPAIARLLVGGGLRVGDAQVFADNLAAMHHLRTVRRGNQIELVRE